MTTIKHFEARLSNGLRLVTLELPHLHTVSTALGVRVGSRYEEPPQNGLSHFLEHMFFRGTDRYPTSYELSYAIETLGGTLAAETGRECSFYQIQLDPAHLGASLEILCEILRVPRFCDIDLERELILEEVREDFSEDDIEICGDEISRRLLFPEHPLGQRIAGSRENIERFGESDLRRHWQSYYGARNSLLCVAGPVRADQVAELAERALAPLPPGQEAACAPVPELMPGPSFTYVADPGPQTHMYVTLRALPEPDEDAAALQTMVRILDDGNATRLHHRLSDGFGLAYSLGASLEPLHDVALFDIDGSTSHAKVPQLLQETLALLSDLREFPVTDAELDKAKRRFCYDLTACLDDGAALASWYGSMALYEQPLAIEQRKERIEAVTPEDIRRVAQRIVCPERLAVVVVGHLDAAKRGETRAILSHWQGKVTP